MRPTDPPAFEVFQGEIIVVLPALVVVFHDFYTFCLGNLYSSKHIHNMLSKQSPFRQVTGKAIVQIAFRWTGDYSESRIMGRTASP